MLKKIPFLILAVFLCSFTDPIDLSQNDRGLYSLHGEDGILQKIFTLIKPISCCCVELGVNPGMRGNISPLLAKQKWDCILLDRIQGVPDCNIYKEFITSENINTLLAKYATPSDLDILCINVDYNNFHFWKAIDSHYRPQVVVIEYNATHLPSVDKVVKYRPYFCGDGSNYYGASILSLYHLGRAKGYSLIYVEKTGSTLFFLRDDLIKEYNLVFKDMNDVEKIYRYPAYGNGPNGGARQDRHNREYVTSMDLLN